MSVGLDHFEVTLVAKNAVMHDSLCLVTHIVSINLPHWYKFLCKLTGQFLKHTVVSTVQLSLKWKIIKFMTIFIAIL